MMLEDSGSTRRPQSLWTLQEVPEVTGMHSPKLGRCYFKFKINNESLSHLGSRYRYKLLNFAMTIPGFVESDPLTDNSCKSPCSRIGFSFPKI